MTASDNCSFSPSETKILEDLLKNPNEDYKKLISIIDRKIKERTKERKESEEKYRFITENAHDLIAVINDKLKYEYINEQRYFDVLGYTNEDLIGKSGLNFVHPEDLNEASEKLTRGFVTGEGRAELRVRNKNGKYTWFDIKGRTFLDRNDDKKAIVVSRDIIKYKQMEENLRESEKKYRTIFDASPDLIYVTDIKGNILDANQAWFDKNKISLEEIKKTKIIDFFAGDNLDELLESFSKLREGYEVKGIVAKAKSFSGEIFDYEINSVPLKENNRIIKVLNFARDITKRIEMQQKLKDSEHNFMERVKELDCLYSMSKLVDESNISVEDIIRGTLELIPHAWQFSKITCARIIYDDKEYKSSNFKETIYLLTVSSKINGKNLKIEVCYLEKKPFLKEEADLIVEVCKRLKEIIGKMEAEEKLMKSEERYRLISEYANDVFFTQDMNLRFTYISPSIVNLLGYSVEEIMNMPIDELNTPSSYNFLTKTFREELKAERKKKKDLKRVRSFEIEQIHKNGSIVNVEMRITFLRDKNGKAIGILGISRDITKRKQAEQKLKESEERYRLLAENIKDVIWTLDLNFNTTYVSPSVKSLRGYTVEEDLAQSFNEKFTPESLKKIGKMIKKHITPKNINDKNYNPVIVWEVDQYHKDGSITPCEVTVSPLRDKSGKAIGLIGITRNITERKLNEQKLKESEERYRLVSENANDVVFTFDMNLNLIYNSPSIVNLLGYTVEEIMNLKLNEYNTPDSLKLLMNTYKEELKIERRKEKDLKRIRMLEIKQLHKNGSIIDLESRMTFIRDKNGRAIGILGVSRDISKRVQAEQKLKESEENYRKAYEQADYYKDLFMHDINNILGGIQGSVELYTLFQNEMDKQKEKEKLITIIKNQVDKGKKLVNNVRKLSQLDDKIEFKPEKIEVREVLMEAIEFVDTIFSDKFIDVHVDNPISNITIDANELLIDVFENILINSVRYNNNPIAKILIKITKEQKEGKIYIKMEFIDNGIGVSDKKKKILFEKGHKKEKKSKGLGMGLSLVKKIIESYGGEIWVEDKVKGDHSQGANFVILTPESQ